MPIFARRNTRPQLKVTPVPSPAFRDEVWSAHGTRSLHGLPGPLFLSLHCTTNSSVHFSSGQRGRIQGIAKAWHVGHSRIVCSAHPPLFQIQITFAEMESSGVVRSTPTTLG